MRFGKLTRASIFERPSPKCNGASMTLFFVIFTIVPTLASAKAKCEKATTVQQLGLAGRASEQAFAAMDLTALMEHARRAREEILPCLSEKLTTRDAAAFHRLMAMEAFTRRNDKRALSDFHAARRLAPGYELPVNLAPAEHPLRKLYEQSATLSEGQPKKVYPPNGGYLLVGGVRNAERYEDAPVIVQVFDGKNRVLETRYFLAGETLPDWGKNNPFGITAQDLGIDTRPTWTKPTTWWIASGVAGVIAMGFYGAALYEKSAFEDRSTSDSDLRGHKDRANGFGITSAASTGLAVILGGIGVGMQLQFGGEDEPYLRPSVSPPAQRMGGFEHGR